MKYLIKRIMNMSYKGMFETINKVKEKNNKLKLFILLDIVYCGLKYQAGYIDYYLFEMYNLNNKQRKTVLTRGINNSLIKKYNNPSYNYIFSDKIRFNQVFDKYMKRDWLEIKNDNLEEFEIFCKKHQTFIVKPISASCGKGVELIKSPKKNIKSLHEKLLNSGQILAEEVAIQCDEINDLHPYSINTIRVVTLKGKVVTALLRVGNHKNIVDNFNNGGMVSPINIKTGIIEYPAIDKHDNLYMKHPISKISLVGFKIPSWKRVVELCEKAAEVVPEIGYIGWDVCVGNKKVTFIEGNEFPGHDLYQLPPHRTNGIGVYPMFKKTLEEEIK